MVYSAPKEFKVPSGTIDSNDIRGSIKANQELQKKYVEEIQAWAKKNSKDKYAGEILKINHADGYAMYVVFSAKPVKLIHLPIGDAWDSPLAHRLFSKDVIAMVKMEKIWKQ